MEEIKELKLEIEVLKKRVSALEGKERRKKILNFMEVIIIVVVFIFVALNLYDYYLKIIEIFNLF